MRDQLLKVLLFTEYDNAPAQALEGMLYCAEFDAVDIEQISVDNPVGQREARKYGIRMIPALARINDDGIISVMNGLPPYLLLVSWLGVEPTPFAPKD
jgi:hypothetical protein